MGLPLELKVVNLLGKKEAPAHYLSTISKLIFSQLRMLIHGACIYRACTMYIGYVGRSCLKRRALLIVLFLCLCLQEKRAIVLSIECQKEIHDIVGKLRHSQLVRLEGRLLYSKIKRNRAFPSLSAEVKGVSQDRLTPFIIVHLSWAVSIRGNRCRLTTLVALQVKWQAWLGKPYVSVGAGVGNTRGGN